MPLPADKEGVNKSLSKGGKGGKGGTGGTAGTGGKADKTVAGECGRPAKVTTPPPAGGAGGGERELELRVTPTNGGVAVDPVVAVGGGECAGVGGRVGGGTVSQPAAVASKAPHPPARALPSGWTQYTDAESGTPYYHCRATGETQWFHP